MSPDFSFRKSQRIRHATDFARIYGRKLRAGDNVLLIFADASPVGQTRIGLSVSKKNGNAVRRQRIKRLIREAFRLEQHAISPGLDLILIPRVNSGAELSDYRQSLVRLTRRLHKRLNDRGANSPVKSDHREK